jgi:acyl-CoA thioester hydrolase
VWHGHYYKYLELARTALLRGCGLDGGDLAGSGYRFVVIESRCRHVHPLRYADRVRVTARLRDLRHRIAIRYEVANLTAGRCAARAETVLATTTAEGRLLLETPPAILRRLRGE